MATRGLNVYRFKVRCLKEHVNIKALYHIWARFRATITLHVFSIRSLITRGKFPETVILTRAYIRVT